VFVHKGGRIALQLEDNYATTRIDRKEGKSLKMIAQNPYRMGHTPTIVHRSLP